MKKLKRYLEKLYEANHQHLFVDSMEVRNNNNTDCYLDIFAININNKKYYKYEKYLFSIYNKTALIDYESIIPFNSYRTKLSFKKLYSRKVENINVISYTPFYCNRTFFLNKYTKITEEDILMCSEYFCNEVLDLLLIWNISIYKEDKDE